MTLFPEHMLRWIITSPGVTEDPDQFPLLPGQMLVSGKAPIWSTAVMSSTSGRERRRSNWSYPRWRIRMRFEVIRDRPTTPELDRMYAFFSLHKGMALPFSYWDPFDHTVTDEQIGVGDGTQDTFQLTRTYGPAGATFTEPVRRVIAPVITVDGVTETSYSIDSLGRLVLDTPPATGDIVRWSGQFMHLCRFTEDEIDPEQMTHDLWSLAGIELLSVKR